MSWYCACWLTFTLKSPLEQIAIVVVIVRFLFEHLNRFFSLESFLVFLQVPYWETLLIHHYSVIIIQYWFIEQQHLLITQNLKDVFDSFKLNSGACEAYIPIYINFRKIWFDIFFLNGIGWCFYFCIDDIWSLTIELIHWIV